MRALSPREVNMPISDGQRIEAALNFLNPNTGNKLLRKLVRPLQGKASECINYTNSYLKNQYREENLTEFTCLTFTQYLNMLAI